MRSALGGVLAEDDDPGAPRPRRGASSRSACRRDGEWRDLRFAWDVVRHVKSNGVVIDAATASRAASAPVRRTA